MYERGLWKFHQFVCLFVLHFDPIACPVHSSLHSSLLSYLVYRPLPSRDVGLDASTGDYPFRFMRKSDPADAAVASEVAVVVMVVLFVLCGCIWVCY